MVVFFIYKFFVKILFERFINNDIRRFIDAKMTKRAIIVVGAESTGTRIFTKIIIEGGFYGHSDHQQLLDNFLFRDKLETEEPLLVIRRSYPHDGRWTSIKQLAERFKKHGYNDIRVVVTTRDWSYCIPSVNRMRHARPAEFRNQMDNIKLREKITQEAYLYLFSALIEVKLPFIVVTYENLVHNTDYCLRWLHKKLELPKLPSTTIVDANLKYRKRENDGKKN